MVGGDRGGGKSVTNKEENNHVKEAIDDLLNVV